MHHLQSREILGEIARKWLFFPVVLPGWGVRLADTREHSCVDGGANMSCVRQCCVTRVPEFPALSTFSHSTTKVRKTTKCGWRPASCCLSFDV